MYTLFFSLFSTILMYQHIHHREIYDKGINLLQLHLIVRQCLQARRTMHPRLRDISTPYLTSR